MERARTFLAALAGVLLSLPAGTLSATTCIEMPPLKPIHRVFGVVLFLSGDRIPHAKVTVLQRRKEIAAQETDKDGKFSFEGLKAGHYEMRVQVEGVGAAYAQIVLIRPDAKSNRELAVNMSPNGVCSSISLVNPKRFK
jgi:uncharacterized protein (DUF2141 family)